MTINELMNQYNLDLYIDPDDTGCLATSPEEQINSYISRYGTYHSRYYVVFEGLGLKEVDDYLIDLGYDAQRLEKIEKINLAYFSGSTCSPEEEKELIECGHATREAWRRFYEERFREFSNLREAVEYAISILSELDPPTDRYTAAVRSAEIILDNRNGKTLSSIGYSRDFKKEIFERGEENGKI